jgi:hypothetical protein
MQRTHTDQLMQQCIQYCRDCHAICEQTILYDLQRGGPHVEANHMQRLLDCAQLCQTCEDFMLRISPLHPQMCGICAQACLRCAESCELFGNDQQMQACAQMCRQCAQCCQQMAAM